MDLNLKYLFQDNEGKKFSICKRNWKIKDSELCIQLENNDYVPVCTDHLSNVLIIKIWEVLHSEKRTK